MHDALLCGLCVLTIAGGWLTFERWVQWKLIWSKL